MIVKDAVKKAHKLLSDANVGDAFFESELLLRQTLNINRAEFFLRTGSEISGEEQSLFFRLVERRAKGEPSAYILGKREFYGLEFLVDPRVLIPRPETELLVEEAISILNKTGGKALCVDVGTGSGAIPISITKNTSCTQLVAIDLSEDALEVAHKNCLKHKVEDKITLICGNLLEQFCKKADLITANLPYIKNGDGYDNSFEPKLALDGGTDGLEIINRLCRQIGNTLKPCGTALFEVGLGQAQTTAKTLKNLYPKAEINIINDFSEIERIVKITMP